MSIRATLMRAAGAFLMTTVLFAAAMVIAHGLAIPDPVGRFLPPDPDAPAAADGSASEASDDDIALTTDHGVSTPQTLEGADDASVPEVTAVPTPSASVDGELAAEQRAAGDRDDTVAGAAAQDGSGDDPASGATGTARDRDAGDASADSADAPDAATDTDGDDGPSERRTRSGDEPVQQRAVPDPGDDPVATAPEAPATPTPQPQPTTQTSSLVVEPTHDTSDDRDTDRHDRDGDRHWWDFFRRDDRHEQRRRH